MKRMISLIIVTLMVTMIPFNAYAVEPFVEENALCDHIEDRVAQNEEFLEV